MIILIALLSLCLLTVFLRRKGGYVTFPALLAGLYIAWVIPQLYGVSEATNIPSGGLLALTIMALLCMLAAWAGWSLVSIDWTKAVRRAQGFESKHLILATAVATVASVAINALLDSMRPAMAGVQQWSGPIVIVAFFAQIRNVALVLSLLLVLHRRTKMTILLAGINLATTLPVAFILLRRSEMIEVVVALMGAYWFAKRRNFNVFLIVPVVIALTVTVYSIGALRGVSHQVEMDSGRKASLASSELWSQVDIGAAFKKNVDKAFDFTNAVYIMEYRQRSMDFVLGANVWDGLVLQYVPGQILGSDFKRSLLISGAHNVYGQIGAWFGFDYQVGTTSTGFGTAFSDFWYFGAIYFFLIAAFLKRLFVYASAGDVWCQVLYLSFLPSALIAVTHGHERFIVLAPFFYGVVFLIKRMSGRQAKRQAGERLQEKHA